MRITKFIHSTWKAYKFWASSGPYFLVFRLNTDIYVINFRIQFEYGKIRIGRTPNLETILAVIIQLFLLLYLIRMLHPITLFAMPRKQNKTKRKKTKQKVYDLIYTRAYLGPCQTTTIGVLDTSLISFDIAPGHSAQLRPLTCSISGLHGYKVTLSI